MSLYRKAQYRADFTAKHVYVYVEIGKLPTLISDTRIYKSRAKQLEEHFFIMRLSDRVEVGRCTSGAKMAFPTGAGMRLWWFGDSC